MKAKIKIEKVFEKSCNGKYGTFMRQAVQDEYTQQWFSAPKDQWTFKPEKGQEYEIEYETNNGFNNISFPKKNQGGGGASPEDIKEIKAKLDMIIKLVSALSVTSTMSATTDEPPMPDDCPFPG